MDKKGRQISGLNKLGEVDCKLKSYLELHRVFEV